MEVTTDDELEKRLFSDRIERVFLTIELFKHVLERRHEPFAVYHFLYWFKHISFALEKLSQKGLGQIKKNVKELKL